MPNAIYHVRLVARNGDGTTFGPDVVFKTDKDGVPGPPMAGKTFNVSATGLVLIKLHGVFVPLTELRQIPNGTIINALHGTLTLITAGGTQHATLSINAKHKKKSKKVKTQTGKFGGAVFKVTQTRSGLATISLVSNAFKGAPSFASCKAKKGKAVGAAVSSKTLQLLHSSAHGKFRTKGKYAAATVRGTIWTIADRCDGTLTHAIKDTRHRQRLRPPQDDHPAAWPQLPGQGEEVALAHPFSFPKDCACASSDKIRCCRSRGERRLRQDIGTTRGEGTDLKRVGLAAVAALLLAASSAQAATPAIDIHSAGPLSDIYIGNDLSCQVRSGGFSSTEFFPNASGPGDCGTFFNTGSDTATQELLGPDFANHAGGTTHHLLQRSSCHAR